MTESDAKKRVSITGETTGEIQQAWYDMDNNMSWMIALATDTGIRLAETAGLYADDLHLDEEVPFVHL